MVKRKISHEYVREIGSDIPLPIQTFLWRQTSAFIRPKLGKQYEASCVSFERVLVENKLQGLSPALCEALQSVTRWQLIQTSLPHVMHCTATLLSNRNKLGHQDKLGVAETKLLYTLHWMLLEAPQECAASRGGSLLNRGGGTISHGAGGGSSSTAFLHQVANQASPSHAVTPGSTPAPDGGEVTGRCPYGLSMATVELFVFLFAPLVNRIKESDLTFRLASGQVIWQPMWEHRLPEIPAFAALIKPTRNIITGLWQAIEVVCELCQAGANHAAPGASSCQCEHPAPVAPVPHAAAEAGSPPDVKLNQATYFDVAALRCLFQPHWSEEGVHWGLTFFLQRLRQILEEHAEQGGRREPDVPPRPRSHSVAVLPSLVNTRKTQDMAGKRKEEPELLNCEPFPKVSTTSQRRSAVPDLTTDISASIFKRFKSRREDRERKGSIPAHQQGKKRQRRMGVPFLVHEDAAATAGDASPTRSTFSFSGGTERTGWQTAILGKFSRRGSSDTAEIESLHTRHAQSQHALLHSQHVVHSHSQHALLSDIPDHSNSHGDNSLKEVKSQISTISVATFNTTLASFNVGYSDFFAEHMRKLCSQTAIPEMPREPLACANLPRSLTDSCLTYSGVEDPVEPTEDASSYICRDGTLDYQVIARALSVVLGGDISSRVCDTALHIIHVLLQLGLVAATDERGSAQRDDGHPQEQTGDRAPRTRGGKDGVSGGGGGGGSGGESSPVQGEKVGGGGGEAGPAESMHKLALIMLIRVIKSLGCAYGCGEGHRGLSGDRLRSLVPAARPSLVRSLAHDCLSQLYHLDKAQFRRTLREYVGSDSLNNVVDFLHALLGFCMEPPSDSKAGFGNDFSMNDSRCSASSIESVIIGCTFKALITRCASATHELHSSDNLGLYCDIRQLVQFIKESHGNVFRRVALSALLDSAEKVNPSKKTEHNAKNVNTKGYTSRESPAVSPRGQPGASQDDSRNCGSGRQPPSPEHEEQLQGGLFGRKEFWRKMFKSQSAHSDSSSQSEQDTSECTTAHSGTTTDRRSRTRTHRVTLRKKLKLPLGNWLKRGSLSGTADPREDLLDVASIDRLSFIRQNSKVKFTSVTKLSEAGGLEDGRPGGGEEEENFFKRLMAQLLEEHLASGQEAGRRRNLVNISAIRLGMKRLQFLLNCNDPGTIPDASILAAALDLEAPVVARAALFLECARFVHRCNRGNWPEWMKGHHVTMSRRGLSRGRSPVAGSKRNQRLQWNASKLFFQWGEAIGVRLDELSRTESETPVGLLGLIHDDEMKKQLKMEDEEEDFLDDSSVNPSKCGCPFPLKMAACQLLMEITTFLRETFPLLPKPRTEPAAEFDGGRHRLDPEMDRHRYERKISFAGVLDDPEPESHESLHSSSHTLKSETTWEERRMPRRVRQGASRLLQIKGTRSFRVKKGGSLSSIWRAGSLKGGKLSRQDSESENEELLLSQSHDTVTDIGSTQSTSDPSIEPDNVGGHGADDNYHKNMPWLEVMILLCNQQNFICQHADFCHPGCYQRHGRACARLVRALKLVYGDSADPVKDEGLPGRANIGNKKTKESDKSSLRPPSLKKRTSEVIVDGKKDPGMLKYIRNQVMSLAPAPLSLLIKAATIMTEDMYSDVQPAAWELLLSVDEHMAATAAAMFLLCAVKVPEHVTDMIMSEFHHQDATQRINSILRFGALWRFRYQVWPRMEEGAPQTFKVPPPSINFTLPSPILGVQSLPVFDPPWVPQSTDSVQDAISEDASKSFSAKAVSRSHQRAEHILKSLQHEEERRRLGREASLITTVPLTQKAGFEPSAAAGTPAEQEEDEAGNLVSRRLSMSPSCTSSASHRNYSFRRGSQWSVRSAASAEEEHGTEHTPTHFALQPPQAIFPACICACVLAVIDLMEDGEVREDGVTVCAVAQQVLWNCLIEDPALVLRHFLERFTVSNRQEELIFMLRKLLINVGELPPQTSHILFNYLIGLIMYFVRTPCDCGEEAVAATLTFLWQVVSFVEGLFIKDLKQTLKKEQCDLKLLVTAAMPGTKTLVVHGPNECDIPTQLPVHEDTLFEAVLKESLEFFNIPEAQSENCFLMDRRRNIIHYSKTYVRDIYPFRRSVSPQLILVKMDPEKGATLIQKQVLTRKLEEVGRLLFAKALTQHMPHSHLQSHVSVLQEDLLRLPSFPRKAIEAEFSLFTDPQAGKELFAVDCLQKLLWIRFLEEMFLGMPSEFPWGDEVMLFLNVFNGALLLHCEDSSLLRQFLATTINTALHFNHLFSLNGYQWILPTILQVFTSYKSNPLLREMIEFACRQFYILHRKPFLLQLFASVAPLLEISDSPGSGASGEVSPQCLFDLLISLERDSKDTLDVLELVKAEKPLKSLDFCYGNEDLAFSMAEAIKLCVTVVAYAPESFRSLQMLSVVEALVPCYLQRLKTLTVQLETPAAAREEITAIANLATCVQALLYSAEPLTRPMTAPQVSRSDQTYKGAAAANHTTSGGASLRDELRLLEEGQGLGPEELDERLAKEEFRRPRESLLNICTDFFKHSGPRLKILQSMAGEPRAAVPELLDVKSHIRLAEIAHSLLKLAPYDGATMESRGLRRYMTEMLPITDWSSEAVRPALILIIKRLDRMFNKIHKMPTLRRQIEWEGASSLIQGVCITLQKQPIISFLPHVRSLINICVNLVMGVVGPSSVADGLPLLHLSPYLSPPLPFSTAVVKLVALQIQALKEDFPLHLVISPFTNQERREGMLLNLFIPFVLAVGSGNRDAPRLQQSEVLFLLQTVLHVLLPPRVISTSRSKNFLLEGSPAHCPNTAGELGRDSRKDGLAESTSQAAFLALKVLLVCFERQLGPYWYKLSLQVMEMAFRKVGVVALWDFMDFIVRTRIPLFVLLRPFIQCKLLHVHPETAEEEAAQRRISEQLERRFIPRPLSKSSLVAEFNNELKILKEAVHSGTAYQGKTSISTLGTNTSAYRMSLATMSRSNTGTGTVWEQESQPSHQASQDTINRTDEEDAENQSVSMPSVMSERDEAFLASGTARGRRRLSSHVSCMSAPQTSTHICSMLPSQSEPNVLEDIQSLAANLSRVASVQSEPGRQNLLTQQPLGRKRGLKQPRRLLLSREKTQHDPRPRHAARLSTTRRSIQPKSRPLAEQKRSVTFTEEAGASAAAPGDGGGDDAAAAPPPALPPGEEATAAAAEAAPKPPYPPGEVPRRAPPQGGGRSSSLAEVTVTVTDLSTLEHDELSEQMDLAAEMEEEFNRGLLAYGLARHRGLFDSRGSLGAGGGGDDEDGRGGPVETTCLLPPSLLATPTTPEKGGGPPPASSSFLAPPPPCRELMVEAEETDLDLHESHV
ncbi:protein unc-80 homolog [Lampetra planeri]